MQFHTSQHRTECFQSYGVLMRECKVARVKEPKCDDTKSRLRSCDRKYLFYYRSFAFATFAFAFLCMCTCSPRFKIILAVKVASATKNELWENISNKECLMMKFKNYCVDSTVSRLVSDRSLEVHTHYGGLNILYGVHNDWAH